MDWIWTACGNASGIFCGEFSDFGRKVLAASWVVAKLFKFIFRLVRYKTWGHTHRLWLISVLRTELEFELKHRTITCISPVFHGKIIFQCITPRRRVSVVASWCWLNFLMMWLPSSVFTFENGKFNDQPHPFVHSSSWIVYAMNLMNLSCTIVLQCTIGWTALSDYMFWWLKLLKLLKHPCGDTHIRLWLVSVLTTELEIAVCLLVVFLRTCWHHLCA